MPGKAMWKRGGTHFRFKNDDLDYYFQLPLGFAAERGSQIGECFAAADRIKERNAESWVRAWQEQADQVRAGAHRSYQEQHVESARDAYLRAYTYGRTATLGMFANDPRFRETCRQMEADFTQAAALMPHRAERLDMPVDGFSMPGWLFGPADVDQQRPTLVVVPGGEMFAEDNYFTLGAAGVRRGWNVVVFDGVGAGFRFRNPTAPPSRTDANAMVSAVLDSVSRIAGVDPNRLALMGFSGGGFMTMLTAAHDSRVRAAVAHAPIYDMHALAATELPAVLAKAPSKVGDAIVKVASRLNPFTHSALDRTLWCLGRTSVFELVDAFKQAGPVPLDQISCPVLCLAGESESPENQRQQRHVYETVSPRFPQTSMRTFKTSEGADVHCSIANWGLVQQAAYDWLDDVVASERQLARAR